MNSRSKMKKSLKRSRHFGLEARGKFYEHMEQSVEAGISVKQGFETYMTTLRQNRMRNLVKYLGPAEAAVKGNTALEVVLSAYLPFDEQLLLNTSMRAGDAKGGFNLLIERVRHKSEFGVAKAMKLLYPLFGVGLAMYVWQVQGNSYTMMEQTTMAGTEFTGLLGFVAAYSRNSWWIIPSVLSVLLTFAYLIARLLPTWTGPRRKRYDKFPIFSMYRELQAADWMTTFATLLKGGMSDLDALKVLRQNSSPYVAERISYFINEMEGGMNLGTAVAKSGFNFPSGGSAVLLQTMAVTKDYGDRLLSLSKRYQASVFKRYEQLVNVWNTGLLILGFALMGMTIVANYGIKNQIEAAVSAF